MKTYIGKIICAAATLIMLIGSLYSVSEAAMDKTLIVYYSRTGNTRAGCEAMQKALGTDILEIKDLKNRVGGWGFFRSAFGSLFGLHTRISPESPDLSSYSSIIIGSPIWTGKLSMAIRTFIDRNRFDGKKVIIYTTTNAAEKEKHKEKTRNLIRKAGGEVVGYIQILAREKIDGTKTPRTTEQMISDTLTHVSEIKKIYK
ncbi:MAG: flavodoxin family protein [Deltaproteobacteria bacterium]|nr:flavodoxin family protein [Deltaproteobacteria bacterium]